MVKLAALLEEHGAENVLCILSTVSVFAPRAPDDIVGIATLCKEKGVPHVANNAYGLQASKYVLAWQTPSLPLLPLLLFAAITAQIIGCIASCLLHHCADHWLY